jgi:pimeloyl-ACP methyl ester carboxylesterase
MVPHQAAILIAALLPVLTAQETRVLTYRSAVDQTDQPFAVYLPKGFDPARKYPLILSLHGAGGDHRSGLRQIVGPEGKLRDDLDVIVAAPYGRGSMAYSGVAERDVLDVLSAVHERFPIDTRRVYLSGVSMGASGAYSILLRYPKYFAAAQLVCGMPPPALAKSPQSLPEIPIAIFHGEKDELVPVAASRDLAAQLKGRKHLRYTEFPGLGHNIAPQAYAGRAWLEWLLAFEREPQPVPTFAPISGIKAILAESATYVYGDGSANIAREAANWSGLRGRPAFHNTVAAHTDPLPPGALFLFGTHLTNRAIASVELPLRLRPEFASTHGLLILVKVEGRSVAVSSGLPWWNGKDLALDRGFRYQWLSLPYRLLESLPEPQPDWVLFSGSLDHVLAQGHLTERKALTSLPQIELRP